MWYIVSDGALLTEPHNSVLLCLVCGFSGSLHKKSVQPTYIAADGLKELQVIAVAQIVRRSYAAE